MSRARRSPRRSPVPQQIFLQVVDVGELDRALRQLGLDRSIHEQRVRHPVDHAGLRRCVHTREFREAEKKFPKLREAKELLKRL